MSKQSLTQELDRIQRESASMVHKEGFAALIGVVRQLVAHSNASDEPEPKNEESTPAEEKSESKKKK